MGLSGLLGFLLVLCVVGAIFWLIWYFVCKLPAPINPPAQVICIVIFIIILIYLLVNFLPGLGMGHRLLG